MNYMDKQHELFCNNQINERMNENEVVLIYLIGATMTTREHFNKIYDKEEKRIYPQCLQEPWQTNGTLKLCRFSFQLWNDYVEDKVNGWENYLPYELFCSELVPIFIEAIIEAMKMKYIDCEI